MENVFIKFKNDFKRLRNKSLEFIKQHEEELEFLVNIKNNIKRINAERMLGTEKKMFSIGCEDIKNKLVLFSRFTWSFDVIEDLINRCVKGEADAYLRFSAAIYEFSGYVKYLKSEVSFIREGINAFDNDKIKAPINDVEAFYCNLLFTTLSLEEFSRVFGMVIAYNSSYAKKHVNHKIKNIDIINKLALYYNMDGTFKYNIDINNYKELMNSLLGDGINKVKETFLIAGYFSVITIDELASLLLLESFRISNAKEDIHDEVFDASTNRIKEKEDRTFLLKLKKYYKNGEIIALPDDLDLFYEELDNSCLDEQEKIFIKKLISKELLERNKQDRFRYFSDRERRIYDRAIGLVYSLNKNNADVWKIKEYLDELEVMLDLINENCLSDDITDLLREFLDIIGQLDVICSKYEEVGIDNFNRYVFLLDKNNVPYILEDVNKIDSSYRNFVRILISRIVPDNSAKFKPIKNNIKLKYLMHEYLASGLHVAFVEINGIYVIIGVGRAGTYYDEFLKRLRNNTQGIRDMELLIRDVNKRDTLLSDHSKYLDMLDSNKAVSKVRKK